MQTAGERSRSQRASAESGVPSESRAQQSPLTRVDSPGALRLLRMRYQASRMLSVPSLQLATSSDAFSRDHPERTRPARARAWYSWLTRELAVERLARDFASEPINSCGWPRTLPCSSAVRKWAPSFSPHRSLGTARTRAARLVCTAYSGPLRAHQSPTTRAGWNEARPHLRHSAQGALVPRSGGVFGLPASRSTRPMPTPAYRNQDQLRPQTKRPLLHPNHSLQ